MPAFEAALRIAPDYFNARLNLGRALRALGRGDAARAHLERAARLQPAKCAHEFAPLRQQARLALKDRTHHDAVTVKQGAGDCHDGGVAARVRVVQLLEQIPVMRLGKKPG